MVTNLDSWRKSNVCSAVHENNGAIRIFPNEDNNVPLLFKLKDYVVLSALSGPSYLLTPRE
jgi:hypothetical protein